MCQLSFSNIKIAYVSLLVKTYITHKIFPQVTKDQSYWFHLYFFSTSQLYLIQLTKHSLKFSPVTSIKFYSCFLQPPVWTFLLLAP